jgi:glucose-1-phosphate adenylyltransferase
MRKVLKETVAIVIATEESTARADPFAGRALGLLPVVEKRCLVDYSLANCLDAGLMNIGLIVQAEQDRYFRHLRRAWGHMHPDVGPWIQALPPLPVGDQGWYEGTLNALARNLPYLRACRSEYVIVTMADWPQQVNYQSLLDHHILHGADMTVAVTSELLTQDKSQISLDIDHDQRIIAWNTSPPQPLTGQEIQIHTPLPLLVVSASLLVSFPELCSKRTHFLSA